ncbi:rhomboid family intramembrane serine protease [Pedosphaera parvula]|uniref:Rhomboid family protein n=1 Tax=Pedosphaera parvula (strain Ellin514) TaxID=320771 RepID=B9XEX2_PEDPL|nr:rhomboid family intramembrane serine protease [Pedosphaera parvula]EEF61470.1 Rhomboid family protein [Pedosphaera parvula Ellin514]
MSGNPTTPWTIEGAFPEKPFGQDYGYVLKGKLIGCTREELIARCSSADLPYIQLVWHPESARVVPLTHVEFLYAAFQERNKKILKGNLLIGLVGCIVFGILFAFGGNKIWFGIILVFMGVLPVAQNIRGLRVLKHSKWSPPEENENVERYVAWVDSRKILYTWIILALLICIMAVEMVVGIENAIRAADLNKHAVWRGEWWRLFTGPLLHGGIPHIVFNGMALVGLGRLMEVLATRYHLAVVLLFSALTGSIFSLFLIPNTPSVGASGGLMGLIGFLTVLGLRRKAALPAGFVKSIFINIAIIATIGILGYSIIDNAGHLGGFLGGITMGLLLVDQRNQTLPLKSGTGLRIAGVSSLVMILALGCFTLIKIIR